MQSVGAGLVDQIAAAVVVQVAEQPGFDLLRGVDDELDLLGDGERRSGGVDSPVGQVVQVIGVAAESMRRFLLRSCRSDRSGGVDNELDILRDSAGRSGRVDAQLVQIVLVVHGV